MTNYFPGAPFDNAKSLPPYSEKFRSVLSLFFISKLHLSYPGTKQIFVNVQVSYLLTNHIERIQT